MIYISCFFLFPISEISVKRLRTKICAHDGLLSVVSRNGAIKAEVGKLSGVYLAGAAVDRFGAAVLCDQHLGRRVVDISSISVQSNEIESNIGSSGRNVAALLVLLSAIDRLGMCWMIEKAFHPYSKADKGKDVWDLLVAWIKTFFQDLDRSARDEAKFMGAMAASTLRQYQMALALISPVTAAISRNGFSVGDLEIFRLMVLALSASMAKISKNCIDSCGSEAVYICNLIGDIFIAVLELDASSDGRWVSYNNNNNNTFYAHLYGH